MANDVEKTKLTLEDIKTQDKNDVPDVADVVRYGEVEE